MALYRKRFNGTALRELDASSHLDDPQRKQAYVTFMFDLLAPGYNAFTRVFSFGMDAGWKRALVKGAAARIGASDRVADLACGTGDLAALLSRERPDVRLCAVDISPEMVRAARSLHGEDRRLDFVVGDVSMACLATSSAGGVTIGYGLRNLPVLEAGISEIHRILKPDGVVAILDFFRPRSAAWRRVFLAYLDVFGSLAGWIWHGDPSTFAYIPRSIRRFVTVEDLLLALRRSGFRVLRADRRLGGGIGLVLAQKMAGVEEVSHDVSCG